MISNRVAVECGAGYRMGATTLVAMTVLAVVIVIAAPVRSDSPSYFHFADQRTLLGVPHFMDVISNAPWAVLGVAGLLFACRRRPGPDGPFTERWEWIAGIVLSAAILSVSIGSSYFHLAPGPPTLFWDRLPMTVIFMSFFALVIGDRIGLSWGRRLFWPLVAFGVSSVGYWRYTESLGRGDFRLYLLVQFFPMLAIPLMLGCFPARYTRGCDIWFGLGWYGLAKLFELGDAPLLALTRVASGHTLKHLAAAVATFLLLRAVFFRRYIHEPSR